MATRSRARHFHATAKALAAAARDRSEASDGLLLTAEVQDVEGPSSFDVGAIIADAGFTGAAAGAAAPAAGEAHDGPGALEGDDLAAMLGLARAGLELPEASVPAFDLARLHEEYRWADSKLMQASERLAEAQEQGRKDLVALALMRRELDAAFEAEQAWLGAATTVIQEMLPTLDEREQELDALVESGVRTATVVHELAAVRGERKLHRLGLLQLQAHVSGILDNASTMAYQVSSEAYDSEPDGEHVREVARLRSESTRLRRQSMRDRAAARDAIRELGISTSVGDVAAAGAFLAGEYEGDARSAERMDRIRLAQVERELRTLPEPEAAWKSGLKHPVRFMRARRTTAAPDSAS